MKEKKERMELMLIFGIMKQLQLKLKLKLTMIKEIIIQLSLKFKKKTEQIFNMLTSLLQI